MGVAPLDPGTASPREAPLLGAAWQADQATVQRHREELPDVWEKIDGVTEPLGDPYGPPRFDTPGRDNDQR